MVADWLLILGVFAAVWAVLKFIDFTCQLIEWAWARVSPEASPSNKGKVSSDSQWPL